MIFKLKLLEKRDPKRSKSPKLDWFILTEILANTKLTVEPRFHSHLEQLEILNLETFQDQISFGYKKRNVIKVPGFDEQFDPTR